MIAYTAWDSLQSIARQYDADLTISSEDRIALAPRRARAFSRVSPRRVAERIIAVLALFAVTV